MARIPTCRWAKAHLKKLMKQDLFGNIANKKIRVLGYANKSLYFTLTKKEFERVCKK